ncbi:MAG: MFS transporter [Nitrososphaerota archaeon]
MLTNFVDHLRTLSRNAWLYLISNSIQAIAAGALAVIYTLYLSALGYSTSFIGLILLVGTIGGGIGIIPSQPLVNRFGWRTMLIWSDMIGGVAIFLQLVLPRPFVLVLTSAAVGASVAIVLVINAPFLAANSAPRDRTALFGLNNALQFLASIIGSLLGGALPDWFAHSTVRDSGLLHALSPMLAADPQARAYQLALLVIGALATPSIIPIILMREQPRPSISPAEIAVAHPWRQRLADGLARLREGARGVIGRFGLFQVLLGFGAGLWFPYFNIYLVKHLGASSIFYGALVAVATVLLAFASLMSAPLSERFGKVPTIVISHLCALPFLALMGIVPVVGVISAAYLIRSTLANISGPSLQSFLMGAVSERERVIANGVYNVSWQIAWALGAGAGGLIVARFGYQTPMLVAVPFYGSAALIFAWFFWGREHIYSGSDEQQQTATPLPASKNTASE